MDDILRRARDVIASYGESDRLYPSTEERRKLLDALGEVQKAAQFLDVSGIPPVLRDTVIVDRLLQLTEILNRIEMPPIGDISDQEAMARLSPKRWRLPNTEIDIVLIENGPRARDYLVSAATIDRLPEFYNRVKDLPYKPGPAQQLAEVYRSIGHGGSATIYEAFLNSPVGLSYIVPPRWMQRRRRIGISGLLHYRRAGCWRSRCCAGGAKHNRKSDRLIAHCCREAVSHRPHRQARRERRDGRGRRLPQHPHPNAGQLARDDTS